MRSYTLIAPAKINLCLEIIGSRPDGFHELVMVLQSIDLADQVDLRPIGVDAIYLHCDHPQVPRDQTNLAYRAAELMARKFPGISGVEITIHKHIPIGAGLAGGSTDAAAVLVGLDLMWKLGLTQSELQELGAELGSDVPFCIAGGTALAVGRGDVLSPLPDLEHLYAVLAKYRSLSVSTPWAYQTYRQKFSEFYTQGIEAQETRRQRGASAALLKAISQRHSSQIGQHLHNDLERVILPEYPQVLRLREQFQRLNVLGTMMSGSGPTVFGLTESQVQAKEVCAAMRSAITNPDLDLWVTKFCSSGIRIA